MKHVREHIEPVLNSYSALFFSQNKVLATVLVIVSFLSPAAGLSGLLCTAAAVATARVSGFCTESRRAGLYSFNNLLVGIAGKFYAVELVHELTEAAAIDAKGTSSAPQVRSIQK